MKSKQSATIGVDVSKKTLDTAILFTDGSYLSNCFNNDATGIEQLLTWVSKQGAESCPLCLEATGGLELELCLSSYQAQHPVRLVIPSRIANYRKSLTLRNKTDCDDARLIAQFAMSIPTENWKPRPQIMQCLHDLLKRRRALTQTHTALSNSANTLRDRRQQRSANADLNYIQRRIAQIDATIEKVIASDKQLAPKQRLLCSIPGIGKQTAAMLCAFVDIQSFKNAKQLCAFIGIAPMRNQSGECEAKGHISKIGDARLRSTLFMAALSARAYNPRLRAFANQLQQRRPDLTKKQIIVACAHKLTRIVYGVLKHNTPFDPYHLSLSTP